MSINPALGRIDLRVAPGFRLSDWVDSIEDLGYLLGPARATGARPSDDLLLRVGICAALAGNVMLFAAAIYLGLREGPIYELLNQLSYAAGVLAVLIGGSVFIKSALRAIRRRVLHLDVPIALGIVLAFTGSTYSFFFASGHVAARFEDLEVDEQTGYGVRAEDGEHQYKLGAPAWAGSTSTDDGDVVFSVDGKPLTSLHTDEQLRPGARAEITRLESDGYELAILSGDAPSRVIALGASLGMREDVCIGGHNPEQKATYLREHDAARTLLVGDGLNDQVAMREAACSGTPAVNRPFMASRCDFYFVSPGLHPVAQVLRASKMLTDVVRQILAFAIAYNLVAVSLAMGGLMKPWVAAVLMPLSSLITLAYTVMMLSRKGTQWRS
jgi:cation transport ATPase